MVFRKYVGMALYRLLGNCIPGNLGRQIRFFSARLIFDKCGKNVNLCAHSIFSSRVEIGNNSGIGEKCYIQGKCIIGENVLMGPEVSIWTQNHKINRVDIPILYQGRTEEQPVIIGNDVWIGSRVIILPGVRIGTGAVLGAGAVVAKDIPPYAVAVGNPAQVVRTRL